MSKTILITGSTDGIGLATAGKLLALGHHVLLHGRNPQKLRQASDALANESGATPAGTFVADLSRLDEVGKLADDINAKADGLDVLINNAGVFKTAQPVTDEGFDVRFVVNTFAPYLLTRRLLPTLGNSGRVVNLSSAAQSPVDLDALLGKTRLARDFEAYAQSKLALTMWSAQMARTLGADGPVIVAVNPGSLLGSKMVKDAFGVDGGDLDIGADILRRAALSDEFATATGRYFDNDAGRFAPGHADIANEASCERVVDAIESVLAGR